MIFPIKHRHDVTKATVNHSQVCHFYGIPVYPINPYRWLIALLTWNHWWNPPCSHQKTLGKRRPGLPALGSDLAWWISPPKHVIPHKLVNKFAPLSTHQFLSGMIQVVDPFTTKKCQVFGVNFGTALPIPVANYRPHGVHGCFTFDVRGYGQMAILPRKIIWRFP